MNRSKGEMASLRSVSRSSHSSIIVVDITHRASTQVVGERERERRRMQHRSTNGHYSTATTMNKPSFDVRERIGHKHFIILFSPLVSCGRARAKAGEREERKEKSDRWTLHRPSQRLQLLQLREHQRLFLFFSSLFLSRLSSLVQGTERCSSNNNITKIIRKDTFTNPTSALPLRG